jgi:Transposase DDE domain group 1
MWLKAPVLLRADSGFARDDLMAWCEANGVDFLFELARNERLVCEIATELDLVAAKSRRTGRPERRFKSFMWTTRESWSCRRRVVAKAEWTQREANPRFVVTSLRRDECKAKYLYEKLYCARGEPRLARMTRPAAARPSRHQPIGPRRTQKNTPQRALGRHGPAWLQHTSHQTRLIPCSIHQ